MKSLEYLGIGIIVLALVIVLFKYGPLTVLVGIAGALLAPIVILCSKRK